MKDLSVLITPIPGAHHNALRSALTDIRHSLTNSQQAGPSRAIERAHKYLEWMHEARRRLRNQIRPAELEYLLPSQSYEVVLSAVSAHNATVISLYRDHPMAADGHGPHLGGERVLNGLVAMQADERAQAFDTALAGLEQQVQRFQRQTQLVVLDTNVYMHHPQKLEDIDLAADLTLGIADIQIIVPMVVIDELDKGKLSGGEKGYRAGYSVACIDRIVQAGGRIRAADYSKEEDSRGEVTIEVLFDPPGHVRLPINDDEIVDRAVSLEPLAVRPIRLVTYDTGMAMRARAAHLRVIKLEQPEKEAPKQKRGRVEQLPGPRA